MAEELAILPEGNDESRLDAFALNAHDLTLEY
jgi:hypothetical protein